MKRPNKRRGRPTKSSLQRVLNKGGKDLAAEFRLHPLRSPIDLQFAPYYGRVLNGDVSAISEYIDSDVSKRDLGFSFYELIGRLVTIRFYRAADLILSDVEGRGNIGRPKLANVDAYWYDILLPLASIAKAWIKRYLASLQDKWDWKVAWLEYAQKACLDELAPLACDLERRRVIFHEDEAVHLWRGRYIASGLVPRELFRLLAKQRGSAMRPTWAIRRYLSQDRTHLKLS